MSYTSQKTPTLANCFPPYPNCRGHEPTRTQTQRPFTHLN
jgi:hypothetical protein